MSIGWTSRAEEQHVANGQHCTGKTVHGEHRDGAQFERTEETGGARQLTLVWQHNNSVQERNLKMHIKNTV